MNEKPFDPTDCFDYDEASCEGPVYEYYSRSGITKATRCERHQMQKEAKLDEIAHRYPDSDVAPAWFDPTYAGERWNDDY